MDENYARELICHTGRELLDSALVARTWGNVSCRPDAGSFLITPSGLDYNKTTPDDIVRVKLPSLEWEGARRPSSELGIHAAAYLMLPDARFVIHTHQTCASAIGLTGSGSTDITALERLMLGGVGTARYGLPGSKRLRNAVRDVLETGAHTVLMVNHGALVCGSDKDNAMDTVALLERICRRNLRPVPPPSQRIEPLRAATVLEEVRAEIPGALLVSTDAVLALADTGRPLLPQLDDTAQMFGLRVDSVPPESAAIASGLRRRPAVLSKGLGAFVAAGDERDAEAMAMLMDKAAICALHTRTCRLRLADAALMRHNYLKNYSKLREQPAEH